MVYHVLVSLHWAYTRPTKVGYMRSQYIDTSHMLTVLSGLALWKTIKYHAACELEQHTASGTPPLTTLPKHYQTSTANHSALNCTRAMDRDSVTWCMQGWMQHQMHPPWAL